MAKTSNALLISYLAQQKHRFERQSKTVYRDPASKNVHKLRVTIRRIRAVLWLIEHGSPQISCGKLPTSLRKLGQILGEQREFDVAIRDAIHYHLKVKKLKSLRRAKKKRLLEKIDSKHCKKIQRRLERAIQKIETYPELNVSSGLGRLRARIAPWLGKARIQDNELHELRVTAKKARYALEAIGRPIQPLQNLQISLGRGHDLETLQVLSGKNIAIQSDAELQYRKARRYLQPALRFAVKQMSN